MNLSDANRAWLLDSDPALKWQVERDLLGEQEAVWSATRALTNTSGFGARLLALQDSDGQWAGGAYFPGRIESRALTLVGEEKTQPFIATTWSLNSLREWGVSAETLTDTADRLTANSRWEYDDLPYWGGEVDCCINAFTLCNGAWLGVDVSKNAEWFLETQLADGGWNCEWVEGANKSSFHSTLNSLIGLLEYERRTGADDRITAARDRAQEYLLARQLMFKLSDGSEVGPWLRDLAYPFRWSYSIIRALNYFRDSASFSGVKPDARLSTAADFLAGAMNENGRWVTNDRIPGSVWFEVDAPVGEESKWLTFFALRALNWWDSAK